MEPRPRTLLRYLDENGKDVFGTWISGLRDGKGRGVIQARLNRIASGNFGDCKPVGEGVYEFIIDFGPGYRVYFGEDNESIILLVGGDKSTQAADIKKAKKCWSEYNA